MSQCGGSLNGSGDDLWWQLQIGLDLNQNQLLKKKDLMAFSAKMRRSLLKMEGSTDEQPGER